jgi:uncharacterized protein YbbC (DUF1343 family)
MTAYIKVLPFLFFSLLACNANQPTTKDLTETEPNPIDKVDPIRTGAEQTATYIPLLQGKKVALLVNQTSAIGTTHLADSLQSLGVDIQKIFAPEHGFRGQADAGEQVKDGKDVKTGVPLISLYGDRKKPTAEDLNLIDIVVFDIQDVGARFYTFISSMSYVMEACAENGVQFIVLDRPNPNGHYIDGPLRQPGFESFVGMHPVPVVHGMTVGEYAKMVNGEGWLKEGVKCDLEVIPCANYTHDTPYELPVKPSPNLPNTRAIYLYPSLCFFEGTTVSAGRGTNKQFQVYGHPEYEGGDFSFTPKSLPGAKYPKHKGLLCRGYDLTKISPEEIRSASQINLDYLIDYYKTFPTGELFFLENNFFDRLAGTDLLRKQILSGMDAPAIRATWEKDLTAYRQMRKKYLMYD